uniref:HAD family hydrolase n=1 Tax=Ningiella ruwaisensis TaxID=2364274 RepID=UPI00109F3934|nr:HAD family phosphatase [Ningiella ruwaisensis]
MSKTRIDAILFDKDGTIFDSEQANKTAWMTTTKEFGIDFSESHYQQFVGVPTQDCFAMAKTMFDSDFPWDEFFVSLRKRMLRQFEQGIAFKTGFESFFSHIKTEQYPLALVTSANRFGTELTFKQSGYLSDFQAVVTVDDVKQPKPHPEPYLLACSILEVEPSHTIVFEDSNVGLLAALDAGCKVIGIEDLVPIEPAIKSRCFATVENFQQAKSLLF